MVAHRRTPQEQGCRAHPTSTRSLPPPATPEESAGPVVPLTGPGAPPLVPETTAAPDAGGADSTGGCKFCF